MAEGCSIKILVLNSGSSSQKSALFELGPESGHHPVAPLWEGKLQWDGDKEELQIRNRAGKEIRREGKAGEHRSSVSAMLENLWNGPAAALQSAAEVDVIGHRIVHGGAKLTQPVRITSDVMQAIEDLRSIAPLHNDAGLQGIELAEKLLPKIPQIAVFDTGFHRTLPAKAFVYPGPYTWYEREGIRRFGFHGINHEYCGKRAAQMLNGESLQLRIVSCHLGNGCSLCAIEDGKSIDTTMGFTPLEGLMMGTRSGSVDPGVLLHLMRRDSANADELDRVLNHESGLLGISGLSGDMREIVAAIRAGNDRARLAFDIFIHRLTKEICDMAASLGGMDVLVFTGGIGENSPEVRRAACEKLGFLGVHLDQKENSPPALDVDISTSDSKVRTLVIRAQEDWVIARECMQLTA